MENEMEYPKREWCLYLKKYEDDISKYDGYIGRETGEETTTTKTLKLFDKLGYIETKDFIGYTIEVPKDRLKLGFQSKYKSDYYRSAIKEIKTKYITEGDIWRLKQVFGYHQTLDKILEHSGKITDETIVDIACSSDVKWKLRKMNERYHSISCFLGSNSVNEDIQPDDKIISSLIALKYIGIVDMEDSIERSYSIVDNSLVRNMTLDKLV
jgi:hypothetical protein